MRFMSDWPSSYRHEFILSLVDESLGFDTQCSVFLIFDRDVLLVIYKLCWVYSSFFFLFLNRLCAKSTMQKSSFIQYVTLWSDSYEIQRRVSILSLFLLGLLLGTKTKEITYSQSQGTKITKWTNQNLKRNHFDASGALVWFLFLIGEAQCPYCGWLISFFSRTNQSGNYFRHLIDYGTSKTKKAGQERVISRWCLLECGA